MTPGALVAMFSYLGMLIWPLMGAGFTVNLIQRGAVSLGRINDVLNTIPTIRDETVQKKEDLPRRTRSITEEEEDTDTELLDSPCSPWFNILPESVAIEIKDLCFSYNEGNAALSNINLTINRGEWLGIMGKTGSGKSTLIKIMTRLLDPSAGNVLVLGGDTRAWPLADLRRLFAVSPQDSYLFSDTILSNIGYGLNESDVDLSRNAARMSALERDIAEFADGEDTLIGERGLTLSGGQKQRIAIARALVMDSEYLILDDSLSAVDAETERKILDCLLGVRKGKTTIFISHRVSTLRYANKVLVLDQGKQSEYGSPEELVNAGGFYSRMAALQQLDSVGSHHG
jgi:ATP-binding cassette subfamily B protein